MKQGSVFTYGSIQIVLMARRETANVTMLSCSERSSISWGGITLGGSLHVNGRKRAVHIHGSPDFNSSSHTQCTLNVKVTLLNHYINTYTLHRSLEEMWLQQALNMRWMDDGCFGIRLCDGTEKLKVGGDDRETGTGLPSVCWLSLAGRRRKKRSKKKKQHKGKRREKEEEEEGQKKTNHNQNKQQFCGWRRIK